MESGDNQTMKFGKYAGYEFINIPASYFLWFKAKVSPTYQNQHIHDYIKENLQVLEKQAKEEQQEYFKNKDSGK